MSENKKLLIVSLMQGVSWGGSEELWYSTAVFALNNGVDVTLLVKKWQDDPIKVSMLRKKGANINYLERRVAKEKKGFLKKRFSKTNTINTSIFGNINIKEIDHVLVSQGDTFSAFSSSLFHELIDQNCSVSLISQHLSDVGNPKKAIRKVSKRYVDKLVNFCFVSRRSLENTKRYLISNGSNFHLVNNPVNLAEKKIVDYPKSNVVNFAVVARLDCAFKGQDILLEVLSKNKWKSREWVCNFYGNGIDYEYLSELIDHYELKGKVLLNGHVHSVEKIWSQNNILLLPSISEGTPLSLVEAHLCGRAAVVTDVGGNAEVLINGRTGWLAEAPLVSYIDIALEKAWSMQNQWKRMGELAHFETIKRYEEDAGEELFNLIFP